MSQPRQLAAIMFTDIVGYTAMMQQNEAKALAVIKHYNSALEKLAKQFNGQVLNYYGDGSLCIFSSATDALNCSLAVQKEFKTDPIVPLRIGLHIGEVFFQDGKALGDGVNVASRVQSLGQENTILISDEVQDKIKNNLSITTLSLGRFDFKNVEKSMEVFAVTNDGLFVPQRGDLKGKLKQKNFRKHFITAGLSVLLVVAIAGFFFVPGWIQKNSIGPVKIAIIPFHNQTLDKTFDRYGFGMASEIRSQLALSGQFNLISSDQATLKYAGSNLSPKEIAKELNVDYLLFGSFYQMGDQLKISAELSEAETNKSLWSLPIDMSSSESIDELFSIQARIAQRIMDWFSLRGKIETHIPTDNLTAYQYYLEAEENSNKSLPIAGDQYRKAIQLDSNFHAAYVGLFLIEDDRIWFNGNDTLIRPNDLKPLLDRIEKLSPNSWDTFFAKGVFYYHQMKDYEKGSEFLKKSIEINPEASEPLSYLGALNRRRLNHSAALDYLLKEIKLNPRAASNWNELALLLADTGNPGDAMRAELVAKRLGMAKDFNFGLIFSLAIVDSSVHNMLSDVKQYFGTHFLTYQAKEQRNWSSLFSIANGADINSEYSMLYSNLDKAFASYFTGDFALARIFANKAINLQDQFTMPFWVLLPEDIHILMNDNEKALAEFAIRLDESRRYSHQGQDRSKLCMTKLQAILILSFAGKYEEATKALILLNQRFPEWGDYRSLFTDFRTDKIRKEYPPFAEALKNLKLPPRINFPEEYQDM